MLNLFVLRTLSGHGIPGTVFGEDLNLWFNLRVVERLLVDVLAGEAVHGLIKRLQVMLGDSLRLEVLHV